MTASPALGAVRRSRRAGLIFTAILAATALVAASAAAAADTSDTGVGAAPVGLLLQRPGTFDGYTLYAPQNTSDTYLIDMDGQVVHHWPGTNRPGNSVYLLPNGRLLRTEKSKHHVFGGGRGRGGVIEEIGWDGKVRWRLHYDTKNHLQHHDVKIMPNGNLLLLAWERHTSEEALAKGRDPALLTSTAFWSERIVEIDHRTKRVVWQWRVWDHLVQDTDPTKPDYGSVADSPGRMDINFPGGPRDWLHANSIAYNAALDQVLISLRRPSEIWIIDHSVDTSAARGTSGDLQFRWGNPAVYQRGGPGDRQLFDQHDAQWIADGLRGAGNILVFNNGHIGVREYSTVDEIAAEPDGRDYPRGPDGTFLPASSERVYPHLAADEWWSGAMSGAQRLPNGNTMIVDGPVGRIFEVTADGEKVWEYVNPFYPHDATPGRSHRGTEIVQWRMFNAQRYAPDDPALARL